MSLARAPVCPPLISPLSLLCCLFSFAFSFFWCIFYYSAFGNSTLETAVEILRLEIRLLSTRHWVHLQLGKGRSSLWSSQSVCSSSSLPSNMCLLLLSKVLSCKQPLHHKAFVVCMASSLSTSLMCSLLRKAYSIVHMSFSLLVAFSLHGPHLQRVK